MAYTLAALGLAAGASAASADGLVIEALRMPAWVARNGVRLPAVVGTRLQSGDQLITGADARLTLRIGEGALLALGQDAVAELSFFGEGDQVDSATQVSVFTGSLHLTRLDAPANAAELSVRLASVVARLRAADLWVSSVPEGEIVCLIDGAIEVDHGKDATVRIDSPFACYQAPRAAAPVAVVQGDLGQIVRYTAQDYLKPGSGQVSAQGKWRVRLLVSQDQLSVLNAYAALRQQGYAAEFRPGGSSTHRVYEITLSGFVTEADAQTVADRLAAIRGLEPVVTN